MGGGANEFRNLEWEDVEIPRGDDSFQTCSSLNAHLDEMDTKLDLLEVNVIFIILFIS